MNEIIPGLFISSFTDISIENYNISNVINLSQIPLIQSNNQIKKLMEININDYDDENISKYFTKTSRFICNSLVAKENILVYCYQGKSRSVTIILAFLIKKRKLSFENAINLIKSKRKIDINGGFINQLKLL